MLGEDFFEMFPWFPKECFISPLLLGVFGCKFDKRCEILVNSFLKHSLILYLRGVFLYFWGS